MANTRSNSYSVRTLLLLVVIAALVMSHFVMRRQLQAAREELDVVRKQFGYVRTEDPNLIYVAKIEDCDRGNNCYRLRIPPGHRFLLQMADTQIPASGPSWPIKPTRTISMNPWREGADTILHWNIQHDGAGPTFNAGTESQELFNYAIRDWKVTPGPTEGSSLQASPQKAFRPDEKILFMWWRDPNTNRGIVFWMEPLPN